MKEGERGLNMKWAKQKGEEMRKEEGKRYERGVKGSTGNAKI